MTPTPTTMTEADGWKLVPLEPTEEMLLAGDYGPVHVLGMWRAMLSAAPPAPAPDDLRELREAAGRATPGPWRRYHEAQVIRPDGGRVCKAHFERDTTFIARANPSTVLSLIDRISRLESENARLRELLTPFARVGDDGRGSALPDDAPLAIVNANMPDLPQWLAKVRGVITQGDIRRARAAVSEQKP